MQCPLKSLRTGILKFSAVIFIISIHLSFSVKLLVFMISISWDSWLFIYIYSWRTSLKHGAWTSAAALQNRHILEGKDYFGINNSFRFNNTGKPLREEEFKLPFCLANTFDVDAPSRPVKGFFFSPLAKDHLQSRWLPDPSWQEGALSDYKQETNKQTNKTKETLHFLGTCLDNPGMRGNCSEPISISISSWIQRWCSFTFWRHTY